MKKTLLFSNIIGDVSASENKEVKFNKYMEDYLKENLDNIYDLVFINAPGFGGEINCFNNILKCFNNIGISFNKVLNIEDDTKKEEVKCFIKDNKKIVYFLMGGNPITQREIIDRLELNEILKEYNGLVIGFCAGAINLSKYSIITTDKDFDKTDSYNGLSRVELIFEPHYNTSTDDNRNKEIKEFVKKFNSKIYAVPDESIIVVEDKKIIEYGKIYHFDIN